MLEVCRKQDQTLTDKIPTKKDVIVTKYEEKVTYEEDGRKVIERIPKQVNLTKYVNESSKILKMNTAEEKLAELEKIFTK